MVDQNPAAAWVERAFRQLFCSDVLWLLKYLSG